MDKVRLAPGAEVRECCFCPHCKNLLKNPVQTTEGDRLCKECFNDISRLRDHFCHECRINVDRLKYYEDKAINREVSVVRVRCSYPECEWIGKFKDFESHCRECLHQCVACEICGGQFQKGEIDGHKLSCRTVSPASSHCSSHEMIINHVSQRPSSRAYPAQCPNCNSYIFIKLGSKVFETIFIPEEERQKDDLAPIEPLERNRSLLSNPSSEDRETTSPQDGNLQRNQAENITTRFVPNTSPLLENCQDFYGKTYDKSTCVHVYCEAKPSTSDHDFKQLTQRISDMEKKHSIQDQRIGNLEVSTTSIHYCMVEEIHSVKESLQSTYNGNLVWKVKDIARHCREASRDKDFSVSSQPFFTKRYGYRMRIVLYPSGKGEGNDCLSLFLCLEKSEYDDLLPWPVSLKISFEMLDHDQVEQKEHIQHTMTVTCTRPTSDPDKDLLYGVTDFAHENVLTLDNYVVNDAIFIKCAVEPAVYS